MEKKINIAELLKDCPKGTKLYSPIFGDCTLYEVDDDITVLRSYTSDDYYGFYQDGTHLKSGECMLFPSKENRDWSKFQRPFKDGDIVISNRGDIHIYRDNLSSYCCLRRGYFDETITTLVKFDRLATEEEKQKLFDAIKENGYKWNKETKDLEELPKFKVGDKIKLKGNPNYIYTITGIIEKENKYECGTTFVLRFSEQDNWELVPNKFDIATLKPLESKVLMRSSNAREWVGTIFSHYSNNKFYGCGMCCDQCIPYEGNEHLLGTENDCDNFYKTWE